MGNKSYRKYVKNDTDEARFSIDEEKMKEEERYDGKWVLRTNTSYSAEEVAFQYKQLWVGGAGFQPLEECFCSVLRMNIPMQGSGFPVL